MRLLIGLLLTANLSSPTPTQIATIHRLEDRLMAPCCYTQTIREHQSQVAADMRDEVTALVVSGKSEQEIITYYRTKYGETILVVPDGLQGKLLTFPPMIGFVVATGVLCLFIRRSVKGSGIAIAQTAPNRTEAESIALRQRIRDEAGDF